MSRPVWIVASGASVERWTPDLDSALALPWSEIRAVGAPDVIRATLERTGPDLVLLTSPNGLLLLPEGIGEGFDAACVGEATASAAGALGFRVRHVGPGTGAGLAREMIEAGAPGLVLFLRGDVVRREGPDLLEEAGWRVEERVIYEARPRAAFAAEVAAAPDPAAFVVGSPNAASALVRALERAGRDALRGRPAVAIGETTARRLEGFAFPDVRVAETAGLAGIRQAVRLVLGRDASP